MWLGRTAKRGVLGVTLTVVTLSAINWTGTWFIQESALESVRDKQTLACLQVWADLLAEPVATLDWNRIDQVTASALRDPRVRRFDVRDPRGDLLARKPDHEPTGDPPASMIHAFDPRNVDSDPSPESNGSRSVHLPILRQPVIKGTPEPLSGDTGVPLGFVVASIVTGPTDPAEETARRRLLLLGAVLVAGAGYLLWWLNTMHVGMIEKLAVAAEDLAGGRPTAPGALPGAAGWIPLVAAIRRLGREIRERDDKLARVDDHVEAQVSARTKDLQNLAMRDPLTGLYNRRYLNEVLQQRVAEWRRYNATVSILMIDLDNLKQLNDEYGHQVGDEAIVLLGSVIACQLRAADIAARYGGDEFVVVLPHSDRADAEAIGRRICEQYQVTCSEQLTPARGTLSIGVSTVADEQRANFDDLLRTADAALYEAKSGGKNRVVSFLEDRPADHRAGRLRVSKPAGGL
jgi:diguanylate cyclase (GGDEF)-like protein